MKIYYNHQLKLTEEDQFIMRYIKNHVKNNQDVFIDFMNHIIETDHHAYHYQIKKTHNQYSLMIFRNDKMNFHSQYKVKTNHGRVIGLGLGLLGIISATTILSNKKNLIPTKEPVAIESSLAMNEETTMNILPKVSLTVPENESKINPIDSVPTTMLNTDIKPVDAYGIQKRAETEELYGNDILNYTNRYGMDYTCMVCLLTQERSDNPKDSLKSRKNIGQLTESIIGEKIVAPVFINDKLVGKDSFYILPSCYDDYDLTELKDMGHFSKFSSQDQEIIQTAITLQKEGYNILKKKDAFYHTNTNIQIATALLSCLVNQKKNLISGVMAYHAGLSSVYHKSNQEIIDGNVRASDTKYWAHILQYVYPKEYQKGFTVEYLDETKMNYQLNDLERDKNEEASNTIRR